MITNEQIQELSKKFSIDWYSILREYLQVVFLSALYEDKLSQNMFFKGGTAIRLLLNSFRFSEDLDFTASLSPENIEKLIGKTVEKINLVVPGVSFRKSKSMQKSFSGTLNYNNPEHKHPLNIHVEISYREKPLTQEQSVLETVFPVSPYPLVTHLSWKEIMAEKIRALMTRAKGRDLFDIWYFLSKDFDIDLKLVNKKMELHNKKITKKDIVEKIKSFKEDNLINDLNKYLPSSHRKMTPQLQELLIKRITNE